MFTFPRDVEGWLHETEGEALYRYSALSSGPVVEIGTFKGRSTICLAQGAELVIAVDHMLGQPEGGVPTDYREALEDNLRRYGVRKRIQILPMASEEAAALVKGTIAFLFIDGDHNNCRADVLLWAPRVQEFIAFHDSTTGDVPDAIAIAEEMGFRKTEIISSLTILKKGDSM